MNPIAEDILMHYGMPRRSGRYPWGSGEDPYQHEDWFLNRVKEMRDSNFEYVDEKGKRYKGDTAIAKSMGLSTGQFRTEVALAKDEVRCYNVARAKSLKSDGMGETEIGRIMGVNESTVRSWLNAESEARMQQAKNTADHIRSIIDSKGMVDIGTGVERELGISKEKLDQALYILQREGYELYSGRMEQATNPGHFTTQKVICPPGTEHKEIYDLSRVHALNEDGYVSHDDGQTFDKFVYPRSLDSSRLMIRYDEDGGTAKDGIIELRRGVDDISLGNSRYSQVRIMVDGKKYLKGMAVYSDDMPDGVDVIFNSNKPRSKGMDGALKDIKDDPDNPFGALIKAGGQSYYTDKDGKRQLSLINKPREEGDWSDWADTLPSQFLSKQSLSLAKKQLNLAKVDREAEFDEICRLTNPTVKKYLLDKFASECDAAAVHLKAAALPGQKYHVIIPINTLTDEEIYAPNYENGTKLALVRYPHGGTFEIPILTVNNKHAPAIKLLGTDAVDAVGINHKIAEQLSGADFDGDTVMCIPTNDSRGRVKIAHTTQLPGLEGFEPKTKYAERPGMKYMKDPKTGKDNTQIEMGKISNLITDMTLAKAGPEEIAAAVRHSMVVIDAGKHKLDYKQSEIDNNIKALKKKYQRYVDEDGEMHEGGGASTLISRAKGQYQVTKRQGTPKINIKGAEWYDPTRPEGALIYKDADDAHYTVTKINKRTGATVVKEMTRHQKSTNMAETDDAFTLVSDARHPMELLYAGHANDMKALANRARVEMVNTGKIAYNAQANKTYQEEVRSLRAKLNEALLNKPKEREAQRRANAAVAEKIEADPTMKSKDIKKAKQQAISRYRSEVGAVSRSRRNIDITDREWHAIQSGAVSESILRQILDNTDTAALRQRATPRSSNTMSSAQVSRMRALRNSNYTIAEIAAQMGISTSTVSKYLKGES